jgi:hypothetical protein
LLLASLLLSFSHVGGRELSREEVEKKARELGMVYRDEVLVFAEPEPKEDSLEEGSSPSSTPDSTGPEEPEEIKIIIPRGSTSKDIASILKNNGLIQSEEEFLDYSRARQLNSKLKAGEFLFHKGLSIEEITKILTE